MKNKISFCCFIFLVISCNTGTIVEADHFLTFKDHQIHYRTAGEGKPLLFLHGGYLNLEMWNPQIEFFKNKGYQTLRYSDLGHGQTVNGKLPAYSSEIIDQLLTKCTDQKITLVGLSWGGMLAVDYVLKHPQAVEKLVLVSPGLQGWNYFQDSLARINNEQRQIATAKGDTALAAALFHQNWVVGPKRHKQQLDSDFYQNTLNLVENTMRHHWKEDWSALDTLKAIDRLAEIKVPTLILIGDQDALDLQLIGEVYDQGIPNSKLIVLENVAHAIPAETPADFNQLLSEFLTQKNN